MVTETDRNKARSAVVSAYHALDCVTIPFSFLHAFADAAVDAVSTGSNLVTGRNDEAGYVEFLNEDVPYIVRDIDGRCAILVDLHTRKYIGYRVYDPDSDFGSHVSNAEPVKTAPAVAVKTVSLDDLLIEVIGDVITFRDMGPEEDETWESWYYAAFDMLTERLRETFKRNSSALSAQVQDVAGWQREHEALGKLIRLLDAEPSIGDAEMADALEHARCVWDHSHAPDGSPASPASKHGDAE